MFLFNLSLLEFAGLFGAVSSIVVTLYLLSRSRRRVTVATLRFWNDATQPVPSRQRRRIQQPLSLLLQLASLLLLLLALAQLRLGSRDTSSRDHVLVLDTSSWMAGVKGKATLLDEAKIRAKQYVRALPSTDRVMLVRADGLPSPATGMESNRALLEQAIDQSRPGAAALNLEQAFSFAAQIRKLHSTSPGELVFVGAGIVSEHGQPVHEPKQLRVIPVATSRENAGITHLGLRRSPKDPELWQVFASVRNYGTKLVRAPLVIQYGGATVGSKVLDLTPGNSQESSWTFRTRAAGWVEARLLTNDALREDNRAIVETQALKQIKVAVYTEQPDLLRPAFDSHPQVEAVYHRPEEYGAVTGAQVVVFDRFAPKQPVSGVSVIWIAPPEEGSPFRVKVHAKGARIERWAGTHDLGSGIRTKELHVADTQVFTLSPGDIPVADVASGPVIVARPRSRSVALGFHPGTGTGRFDIATPLMMMNILRWLQPDILRASEVHGGNVGAVTVVLDSDVNASDIRVMGERQPLPFTVQGRTLRFFAGAPGDVRVLAGGGEQVHSLSLPEVGAKLWDPPASAQRGVPRGLAQVISRDVWQILAVLGGVGLLLEWIIFGRRRRVVAAGSAGAPAPIELRKAS